VRLFELAGVPGACDEFRALFPLWLEWVASQHLLTEDVHYRDVVQIADRLGKKLKACNFSDEERRMLAKTVAKSYRKAYKTDFRAAGATRVQPVAMQKLFEKMLGLVPDTGAHLQAVHQVSRSTRLARGEARNPHLWAINLAQNVSPAALSGTGSRSSGRVGGA